jgi:hypothetical protein
MRKSTQNNNNGQRKVTAGYLDSGVNNNAAMGVG